MRETPTSWPQPAVKPGQIWLVEHRSAMPLFSCDRAALTSADVVLYDGALAPFAASVLPAGAYAEPLSYAVQAARFALSPRALALAARGWSVAQLVETRSDTRLRLQSAAEALLSLGCAEELPVLIIAKRRPYRQREREACLRTLPSLAGELSDEDSLSLVFGPVVARYPAPCHVFATNGLAG
jgi:siroheme synthase